MKKMMTLMSALVIGIWGSMLSAQGPPDMPSPAMAYHASTGVYWPDMWNGPLNYLTNTATGGAVSEGEIPVLHMTMAQRDAIAGPDKGLQIFNVDLQHAEVYNGVGWIKMEERVNEAGGFAPMPPTGNYWTQKADFGGTERAFAVGFSINNKGYIGTGHDGNLKRDFWEFDPENNVWSQMADFGGTPRYAAVGFSIGNKGYLGNGFDGSLRNDFWEYDPFTNTWTQRADYGGTGSEGAVGFSIEEKGYMGTGNSNGVFKNDLWEYNPMTDTWTRMPDLPGTGRCFGVGFSIGTKGYIGTGTTGMDNIFKDFWEFDPFTHNWTRKADLTGDARKMAVGFSIGNRGYIGTGAPEPFGGENQDFWEYDPDANNWTRVADLAGTGRRLAVGFNIENKGYIGTGAAGFSGPNNKTFWEYTPIDSDADGVPDGLDCAPTDPGKFQSAVLYIDADNDNYDAGQQTVCYGDSIPTGYKAATLGGDCDDTNAAINPNATEVCSNGIDDNCDGVIDETNLIWYIDTDGDGFGSDARIVVSCVKPTGYVDNYRDCYDADANTYPGAPEICDGRDNDCNRLIDDRVPGMRKWYRDVDGDGYGMPTLFKVACAQPAGYVANAGDCNDKDNTIYPGAPELCDKKDNDCNGIKDDNAAGTRIWYQDKDGDGFGRLSPTLIACSKPAGYADNYIDCNDNNAGINPNATELCGNGIDDNCDGVSAPCTNFGIENTEPKKVMNPLASKTVETKALEIRISPNPTSTEILVSLDRFVSNQKVELVLLNSEGRALITESLVPKEQGQRVRFEVSRFASGYYLLQVKQGALAETKKVMIKR